MIALSSLTELLSDWLLHIAGVIGAGVTTLGGFVWRADSRSRKNERRLEGDPDDPNHQGVLQIVSDNNEKMDRLEEHMDEQHERVMDRIEEIADNDDSDD